MRDAAAQAEAVLARDEPVRSAGARSALRGNADRLRHGVLVGGLDLGLGLGQVEPALGQVFPAVVNQVTADRAEEPVACILVIVAGDVIDLAGVKGWCPLAGAPHGVVFLPTVAAEVNGVEAGAFFLAAGSEALGVERDVSLARSLERGEHLARAANELVQLEREGCPALRGAHVVRCHQKAAQAISGDLKLTTCVPSESQRGITERDGLGTPRGLFCREIDAKVELDPDGQRVLFERIEACPAVTGLEDGLGERRLYRGDVSRGVGHPFQRLTDDIQCGDTGAKKQTGNVCDGFVTVVFMLRRRHGRGGTDAHQLLGLHPFSDTAHEHGHIRTLPAAIGMQLVQDQKLQSVTVVDHSAINVF